MRISAKKQILIFAAGSIINIALFALSKYAGFPFWLDYTGSFYITAFCGIVPGLISMISHTAVLCILIDGSVALLTAIPVLFIIFIISYSRATSGFSLSGQTLTVLCSYLCSFIVNTVIILCCSGTLGRYSIYSGAFTSLTQQSGKIFASLASSAMITFSELTISFALLAIITLITPKRGENLIFKK